MKKKIGTIYFSEINFQAPLWQVEEGYQFSITLSTFIADIMKRYRYPQLIVAKQKSFYLNLNWDWLTVIVDNLDFDDRFVKISLKKK